MIQQFPDHHQQGWWYWPCLTSVLFNFLMSLRSRQNGHHFPDDIFKCIFWNGYVWILIKISLKFVPMDPVNNIPALVQIMAWCLPGDKPLSEPMVVRLQMHICITRPQWVNSLFPERYGSNLTSVFFKLFLRIDILSTSCEIGLRWVPQNPTDDNSTLIKVMTWANVDPDLCSI